MTMKEVMAVEGWIFDVYPDYRQNLMVTWLLTERGAVRREEDFTPRIYVGGSIPELKKIRDELDRNQAIKHLEVIEKLTDLRDRVPKKVLEIGFNSYRSMGSVARQIDARGRYRDFTLYNVDPSLPFRYLIEKGLFPNALVKIGDELELLDDRWSMEYPVPDFRTLVIKKDFPGLCRTEKPVKGLIVGGEKLSGNDGDILGNLDDIVKEADPDIIFTDGGDYSLMPYLHARALRAGYPLSLGRDLKVKEDIVTRERSYFTYGRIVYKPAPFCLKGRAHIDRQSFFYRESALSGLVDLSRLSGIASQQLSRLSPGTAISAMQMRQAMEDGYLIMWKKNQPESFKTARDLLRSDRGGFIFDPKVGIFDTVTELDFTSLYPFIISNYNISPETMLCGCCPDSSQRVPVLGYHICSRRDGLLKRVITPLIHRRVHFKRIARAGGSDAARAGNVANIFKWLLVTCFGYTGYKNARFGKIECHEAITAYGREILLEAMEVAQDHGLEILHGIVDSLWLKGDPAKAVEAAGVIGRRIGIPMEVEGTYKWIVFLPNKSNGAGALNKYYGMFENGDFKVRGVHLRRRDTPKFFCDFQERILEILGRADTKERLMELIPECLELAKEADCMLQDREVDVLDLVICKVVSKELSDYSTMNDQRCCLSVLKGEGIRVVPGQKVKFVITDSTSREPRKRLVPEEFIRPDTQYDSNIYRLHLARTLESLLIPFGWTEERIMRKLEAGTTLLDFCS
ncbi:MAG: DNA polymerase domain-containing protein [Candidatus Thermoplasmatota archaeon]|jgi:DNA polymerase elongation subunit (family B)|nr:DNA polymerase domain-containing protein [Candidatus Thermoplasmatota archaeon]